MIEQEKQAEQPIMDKARLVAFPKWSKLGDMLLRANVVPPKNYHHSQRMAVVIDVPGGRLFYRPITPKLYRKYRKMEDEGTILAEKFVAMMGAKSEWVQATGSQRAIYSFALNI